MSCPGGPIQHELLSIPEAYVRVPKCNVNNRLSSPIIDRVTRPLLPSVVPNDEGSRICAADGWIDEGWEHVTGTLSNLSG